MNRAQTVEFIKGILDARRDRREVQGDASMPIATAIQHEITAMGFDSPTEINGGYCEEFALNVIDRMGGYRHGLIETTVEVETAGRLGHGDLPGHVWIKFNRRHYDSESPAGVFDWRDLPYFARLKQIPRYRPVLA